MRRLAAGRGGQAFVELALVLGLFFLVITAILQLVWIGSAQIRCHEAARRAAWHLSVYGNLSLNDGEAHIRTLLPKYEVQDVSGDRETGYACTITSEVPALGYFRLGGRKTFTVRSRSAVIGYNPTPAVSRLAKQGIKSISEWISAMFKR